MRCISRWELLQQIASGMPTDAVLFAAGEAVVNSKGGRRLGEKFVNQHHSFAGLASDVGWFCWLIYDGQLQLSRASCSAVPRGQNDRALKRAAQHIVLDPVSLRFN